MSNVLGRAASRDEGRALPKGETVGTYAAYLDAQKAVDYLADHKFPVERVSIIGNDLKSVERVTGRLSYPRVALSSAGVGAWFGFFVGLILMLFGEGTNYLSVLSAMGLGAAFWLLFGVVTYAFQRGKRDFASTSQVIASGYDVLVDPSVAGDARRLLQQLPMNGNAQQGFPGQQGSGGQPPYGQPPAQPPYGPPSGQPQYGPPQYGPQTGQPPYGPPSGQGQAGSPEQQAPDRPQGWDNPYGQNTGANPPPNTQPVQGQQPASADETPKRGQFPDLPDGRPQYGVRVAAPVQAEQQAGQPSGDQSSQQQEQPREPQPGPQPKQHGDPHRSGAHARQSGTGREPNQQQSDERQSDK